MPVELDSTGGSAILHRAKKAVGVYSVADGDQPGGELNLGNHGRVMGLTPLVCGNIKGFHNVHRNPDTQKAFAEKWDQSPHMVTSAADGSKVSFEQASVANATGMTVEKLGMLGGEFDGHLDELCHTGRYDIDRLLELGGVVDYVVGAKPLPGVFVFATVDDPKQKHFLELYKLGKGPLYSFYTPYHLCHLEVPLSTARAVIFRDPTVVPLRPMVDVVTTAKIDLNPGDVLDQIGGFTHYGLCEKYPLTRKGKLLPQGLAEGCRMRRPVARDTVITYDDVELPKGRTIDQLRQEQDQLFPVD
jgi:predicted homoserine dehydrogenase-like protein